MREIKFRAWNKESNEMYYQDKTIHANFIFSGDTFIVDCKQIREYIPAEKVVLMQYTGLKDKNGRKIYEGDIVKIKAIAVRQESRWHADVLVEYPVEVIEVVKWEIDGFHLIANNWVEWDIEVIGNIYENPELLKEVKELVKYL